MVVFVTLFTGVTTGAARISVPNISTIRQLILCILYIFLFCFVCFVFLKFDE